ncbi:MAG TPA: sensor histidine kinase [Acidimicrobiales bacterium]|jgi:anti-sigma regulatory factor (Ser/Thr protein kinase)|nr:sensor histidine kinase [Acidimicrobiales bacterium]
MTSAEAATEGPRHAAFRHEALLYAGEAEFVSATSTFIREGLAAGEDVLAVVDAPKIGLLQSALGGQAAAVEFADMGVVGRNPGRILDAWYRFATEHAGRGRSARGIGEPVSASRSAAELVECQLHEALLNVAFPPQPAWTLLCPYDTATLGTTTVAEARRTHPFVRSGAESGKSAEFARQAYGGPGAAPSPWQFRDPLPEPPAGPSTLQLAIGESSLGALRRRVVAHAAEAGASPARAGDLALAATELATNSLRHGGGHGRLRLWADGASLMCEVADAGHITDPLVGRRRPTSRQLHGRGLWLVQQLCDLVQVRTGLGGTVVRVQVPLS